MRGYSILFYSVLKVKTKWSPIKDLLSVFQLQRHRWCACAVVYFESGHKQNQNKLFSSY